MIFPSFDIKFVLQSAVEEKLLPAGITRFVVPGRVLRVNVDLENLRGKDPLSHKNAWLNRLIAEKFASRSVRYYQEPVYLLDE